MIGWLLTNWASQIALVVFAAWFLNGLRKAILRPRIAYVMHSDVKGETLLTVRRQERLPPWRLLEETWLLLPDGRHHCIREGDGKQIQGYNPGGFDSELAYQLHGLASVKRVRDQETAEVLKERPSAN